MLGLGLRANSIIFSITWKEVSKYITDKHSWRAAVLFYQAFGGFFFFNSPAC